MRIQWKILALVFLVLIGTISAVLWKSRSIIVKDKLSFVADASMKQMAPFKRLVKERLDEQKSKLVRYAGSRVANAAVTVPNGAPSNNIAINNRARLPEGIDAVALVQLTSTGGSSANSVSNPAANQWAPLWIDKSSSTKAELPAGFEQTLLKSFPYSKVKDVDEYWARVSDRQGAPLYAFLFSVEIQTAQPSSSQPREGALPESVEYGSSTANETQRAVLVALSSSDILAGLTEDFIGSTSIVYLVDDKGYVASHVNKAYLGALFTEDPLVSEIVNSKKTVASGNYEDIESRPVLGHFETIRGTNLFAVISTPLKATQDSVSAQIWNTLLIAFAFGLACLLFTYIFIGRTVVEPIKNVTEAIRALNRGDSTSLSSLQLSRLSRAKDEIGDLMRLLIDSSPAAIASTANWEKQTTNTENSAARLAPAAFDSDSSSVKSSKQAVEVTDERLTQERQVAYETFNEGFSSAMKEPLHAIIGHAQLAKSKTDDEEIRSHTDSIEREARRAKLVLERLKGWSSRNGVQNMTHESVDVRKIIEDLLESRKDELESEGIYVSTELQRVPKIRGSSEAISIAIANLIDNSCEAMRARPKKHLKIQLDFLNDNLYLILIDTGIGMTRDIKDRAFDPFFKGFDSPERLGLGLALVQSAVNRSGGVASIDSTPGEGAVVTLKIPVSSEDLQIFRMAERVESEKAIFAIQEVEELKAKPPPQTAIERASATFPVGASVQDSESPSTVSLIGRMDMNWDEGSASASASASTSTSTSTSDEMDRDEVDSEESFSRVDLMKQTNIEREKENEKASDTGIKGGSNFLFDIQLSERVARRPDAKRTDGFQVQIRKPKARSEI